MSLEQMILNCYVHMSIEYYINCKILNGKFCLKNEHIKTIDAKIEIIEGSDLTCTLITGDVIKSSFRDENLVLSRS